MASKRRRRSSKDGLGPEYGAKWAVVIGINDYTHFPKLSGAVKDAEAMARHLVAGLGFPRENVRCILDPPTREKGNPFTLAGTEGKKEAIEKLLVTDLPKHAGKDDAVVVYFAGHGLDHKVGDRRVGYLVPKGAKEDSPHEYINMEYLLRDSGSCEAKHMFYMLDACFAGLAITRAAPAADRYQTHMMMSRARQVLAAGSGKQVVSDLGPAGHSPFTQFLLSGLAGDADLNHDGFVTGNELMLYVKDQVIKDKRCRQTPVFGALAGHEAEGDFVFRSLAATTDVRVRRAPRAEGGDSIGHLKSSAGTLGCLVRGDQALYILSASQVLDPEGKAKRGEHIVQPAPFDGGTGERDVIATFERSEPKVGAAIARVLNTRLVRGSIRAPIGPLRGVAEPKVGTKLRLFGRTSGLAQATIRRVAVRSDVYSGGRRPERFRGLFETDSVLEGGDAGAVAVDARGRAVGLAFAGSTTSSLFFPMSVVLKKLGVALVCGDEPDVPPSKT